MAPVETALSNLSDDDLIAVATATDAYPAIGSPSMVAWMVQCVNAEQHRRRGIVIPVGPPSAAIPGEEEVAALAAAITLWEAAPDGGVRMLYAAIVKMLTDGTRH
jgi:hypothetical protein